MSTVARTTGPPLYEGLDVPDWPGPLQYKALIRAKRHLFDDHGLTKPELTQKSYAAIVERHAKEHGVNPADVPGDGTNPWFAVTGVHKLERKFTGA